MLSDIQNVYKLSDPANHSIIDEQGDNSMSRDDYFIRPTLMVPEEIGKQIVDVFKFLYGLHMGQTTHLGEVLVPPSEKRSQLEQQVYSDVTFQPKTTTRSAKLATEKYKKDKDSHRESITQMNKQRQ